METPGGGMPRTPDELHEWIARTLEVTIPREAVISGHAAPFDYVAHAFFEGGVGEGGRSEGPLDAVVWANRGGGKTFLGALVTALDLLFKPGIQIRILAGSLEQAGRMHAHLRSFFERPELAACVAGRITERRIRLANGSTAELLAQSEASVRGTRVQKLRCDEVELFTPEVWEAAQLTTRSARCGEVHVRGVIECFSTMHRCYGLMHQIVGEALEGRRRLFRWGLIDILGRCDEAHLCRAPEGDCALLEECGGRAKERDGAGNPPGHLEVDDAVAMKGRVTIETWEAEMLCERPTRTDAVVPEFDARRHVVAGIPADARASGAGGGVWIGGMDFGYRAPTVFLWAFADRGGTVWVVDERVAKGVVLEEHVRAIAESDWPRPRWIGIDPAGRQVNDQTGRSAAELLKQWGFEVRARAMRTQEGLRLVRSRLGPADGAEARLFIHRRCARLIKSIEGYHYPANNPGSVEPVKDGSDHAVDALRYMITGLDRPYRTRHGRYCG